jgi:DNA-binding LytR/AlgR family response regulator
MKTLVYSSDSNLAKQLKTFLSEIARIESNSIRVEKFDPEKNVPKSIEKAEIVFLDLTNVDDVSKFISETKLKLDSSVVLITSNYKGVSASEKRDVLDYFIVPVTKERVKITLDKFNKKSFAPSSISVQDSNSKKSIDIPISKVLYLEAENKYCHIFLQGGKKITVAQTLKSIHQNLPSHFLRVHKTFIVRKDFIKSFYYVQGGSYRVSLKNSTELPVGRQYYKFVKSTLLQTGD